MQLPPLAFHEASGWKLPNLIIGRLLRKAEDSVGLNLGPY